MTRVGPISELSNRYGPLELAIMDRVWSRAPIDVRTVLESLNRHGYGIAYSTVKTVMERLEEKGELTREPRGRQYVYSPVRSRAATEESTVRGVIDEVLARHGDLAVSYFVEGVRQQPLQLARLRQALRDIEQA